jgi:hypothetical protein
MPSEECACEELLCLRCNMPEEECFCEELLCLRCGIPFSECNCKLALPSECCDCGVPFYSEDWHEQICCDECGWTSPDVAVLEAYHYECYTCEKFGHTDVMETCERCEEMHHLACMNEDMICKSCE